MPRSAAQVFLEPPSPAQWGARNFFVDPNGPQINRYLEDSGLPRRSWALVKFQRGSRTLFRAYVQEVSGSIGEDEIDSDYEYE